MRNDLIAIAAMDENRVIGRANSIPWKVKGDLKRFKELTSGNVVVMGRKTLDSLGGIVLPNRTNFILSRTSPRNQTNTFHDLETLNRTLDAYSRRKVFVIGGSEVYRQLLPQCSEFYLTLVYGQHEGDTFMPPFEQFFVGYEQEGIAGDTHEYRHYLRDAPKNFVWTGSLPEHFEVSN